MFDWLDANCHSIYSPCFGCWFRDQVLSLTVLLSARFKILIATVICNKINIPDNNLIKQYCQKLKLNNTLQLKFDNFYDKYFKDNH